MFLEELIKDAVKSGIQLDKRKTFSLEGEKVDENEEEKNTGKKKKCC